MISGLGRKKEEGRKRTKTDLGEGVAMSGWGDEKVQGEGRRVAPCPRR